MVDKPAKPPPEPPETLLLVRCIGWVLFTVGGVVAPLSFLAMFVSEPGADRVFLWSIVMFIGGAVLRLLARISIAADRIASRLDDPRSDESTRRALLGIWETLTKK